MLGYGQQASGTHPTGMHAGLHVTFSALCSMLSNNGLINGRNDGPILSIIQPITIDTILNNNGLNNKQGLKSYKALEKTF